MTGPLQNAVRMQALRAMSGAAAARVGLVTSYDPDNYAVRVALQPDGFLSGWLPLCSQWVGNGWGMFCAPSVGDMVAVHFFGAELEAGFAEVRMFNDVDRPLPVPSGEFWLMHSSGSALKMTNDGAVALVAHGNLVVTVGGNLSATVAGNATADVTGNLTATAAMATLNAPTTINGNTTINGTATVNGPTVLNGPITQGAGAGGGAASLIGPLSVTNAVTAQGTNVHTHTHSGVQTGAGTSGPPV